MPGDQVVGEAAAERPGAARDQDGAALGEGLRQGQHDLAGVPGPAHEVQRRTRVADVEGTHGQWAQCARLEEAEEFGEQLGDPVRSGVDQVERLVAQVRTVGRDGVRPAHVGLAHLDEPATVAQQPQ